MLIWTEFYQWLFENDLEADIGLLFIFSNNKIKNFSLNCWAKHVENTELYACEVESAYFCFSYQISSMK